MLSRFAGFGVDAAQQCSVNLAQLALLIAEDNRQSIRWLANDIEEAVTLVGLILEEEKGR